MKFARAKKISTQQVYNNEYKVIALHDKFDNAHKKLGDSEILIEVSNEIKRGDSINDNGKLWSEK